MSSYTSCMAGLLPMMLPRRYRSLIEERRLMFSLRELLRLFEHGQLSLLGVRDVPGGHEDGGEALPLDQACSALNPDLSSRFVRQRVSKDLCSENLFSSTSNISRKYISNSLETTPLYPSRTTRLRLGNRTWTTGRHSRRRSSNFGKASLPRSSVQPAHDKRSRSRARRPVSA